MSLADLPRYRFVRAGSVAEVCAILAELEGLGEQGEPAPVLLAGGTDFMPEVSQSGVRPGPLPWVIDVSRLDELRPIDWDGRRLRIGAGATYREIQRHSAVRERAPLLCRMAADVGGPTIQARGTLGGNLATASPAADGVCAIAAYDATVEVRSLRGSRRIPIAELQTGYKRSRRAADEVIVAVELTPPAPGSPWIWRKVGARRAQAISKVALAAVAERSADGLTRFGAALASVAPVTALLPTLRQLVLGTPLSALGAHAVDAAVEADIQPIDDLRSTRAYRLHVAKAIVRVFLRELGAAV
jgi:CO/xanthine dehydrogenase FAD-binding subunit